MATKGTWRASGLELTDATTVEQRWARAIASRARAWVATLLVQTTTRIPHHTTRLIN